MIALFLMLAGSLLIFGGLILSVSFRGVRNELATSIARGLHIVIGAGLFALGVLIL